MYISDLCHISQELDLHYRGLAWITSLSTTGQQSMMQDTWGSAVSYCGLWQIYSLITLSLENDGTVWSNGEHDERWIGVTQMYNSIRLASLEAMQTTVKYVI